MTEDADPKTEDTGPGTRGSAGGSAAVQERVRQFLDENGIEWELGGRPGEFVVTLPGDQKLKTVFPVVVGEQSLAYPALVLRNQDQTPNAVYA